MASVTNHSTAGVFAAPSITIDLKAEIEARIGPHKHRNCQPPFELEELAVMAWVCERRGPGIISEESILEWLTDTFKYYRRLSLTDAISLEGAKICVSHKGGLRHIASNLRARMLNVDLPMQRVVKDRLPDMAVRYTSTLVSSRLYLQKTLDAAERCFPRFLDLPPELRLKVYEEALGFPGALNYVDRDFRDNHNSNHQLFRVSCSEWQKARAKVALGKRNLHTCFWKPELVEERTGPSKTILSLLLANRQIFTEAMPVFYNINTFACDIWGAVTLFRHCGARRRQHFSRLEIDCGSWPWPGVLTSKNASILLAQATRLKDVVITTHDDYLPLEIQKGVFQPFKTPHKVSLIKMFIGLGTPSLRFAFGSPEIERYVQDKRLKAANEDSKAIAEMKTPIKCRKRKAPMSAEFCIADDNVPVKKARKTAVPKANKLVVG